LLDSVKMMLDACRPHLNSIDSNRWRWDRLICEEVDYVYKKYFRVFKQIYKKFSGKKAVPGKKPFMCLEEFQNICNYAGFINEEFVSREIDIFFNLSMMT
jgi:hypothetical protein